MTQGRSRSKSKLQSGLLLLIIFVVLIVISVILYFVLSHTSKPTPGPSPIPGPTDPTRLYLYPEMNGYNITDFKGFPSPKIIEANFGGIAAIANSAGRKYNRDYTTLDNFWGPDGGMVEMWDKVEKNYPNMNVEKWIAYDFGSSSPFCSCNSKGRNSFRR